MNCVIRDGRLQIQSKYQTSRTEVLTNWDSFIDEAGNTNGIVYFVQIGTCFTLRVVLDLTSADMMNHRAGTIPGGSDAAEPTFVGSNTSSLLTNLSLSFDVNYFTTVVAVNELNFSSQATSPGFQVSFAPHLDLLVVPLKGRFGTGSAELDRWPGI